MTETATEHISQDTSFSSRAKRLAVFWARGTGIAIFVVTFVYTMADGLAGPLLVTGPNEVTLPNVLVFTIIGGTVGAALAYVIGRFTRSPRLVLLAVAVIALAGYSVAPFTAAESLETAIWLNIFHLVVAIPVIGTLVRYLPADWKSLEA